MTVPTKSSWFRRGHIGLQSELMAMLLATSILSCLVVGLVGYRSGRDALREAAFDRLQELRESRIGEIQREYERLHDSMVIYTRGTSVTEALAAFTEGFDTLEAAEIGPRQEAAVQAYYDDVFIPALNDHLGSASEADGFLPQSRAQEYLQSLYTAPYDDFDDALAVDDAGDGSDWSKAHARYHEYFREMVERSGYEDVLLIDLHGDVVYSAYKGVDLGTNLRTGPFAGSTLATAFEESLASNDPDHVAITDLERYQPSYGLPTTWAVSPVAMNGRLEGALAVQIPMQTINDVMTGDGNWVADGLGETGETYLVGADFLMRSTSRRVVEDPESYERRAVSAGTPPEAAARAARVGSTVMIQPVQTDAVERALHGESGELVERGYLGIEALFAYAPVELGDLQWVIVAEIETSEAFEPVNDFARRLVLSTAGVVLAVSLTSLLLSQVFARPVRRLMSGVRAVAAGDLGATVDAAAHDEFGDLGKAFNEMSRSLEAKQQLLEEQRAENERLLLNLMPEDVAVRYRQGQETIAADHQDVAVVYADLDGLDEFSERVGSEAALDAVNVLMQSFDDAAESLGIERARTLRSGYLATCGLGSPRIDNARRVVDFATEVCDLVERFNVTNDTHITVRAGVDSGSVTSGLVGRGHVLYDLWGDAVNLAHRVLDEHPEPGVFVTGRVHERLADVSSFVEAGSIETQRGPQTVWHRERNGR